MSEWRKIAWGAISTMPEDGLVVVCHRQLPGRQLDDLKCVKMVGEARWHMPLLTSRSGDLLSRTGHAPEIQVSLRHQSSTECTDDHDHIPQDIMFGVRVDTMWWRPL